MKYNLELLSTTEILNLVDDMCGDSIMSKLLDFCETNNIDPQELGDILEEDIKFKKLLYDDCVHYNSVIDNEMTNKESNMQDLEVW